MSIRNVNENDLRRLKELCEMSWKGQSGDWFLENRFGLVGGKPWIEWFWANIRKKFASHPEWMVLTELDGEVAGFACMALQKGEIVGTIGYNALDPRFRGKGLGKAQMRKILGMIKENANVRFIEVVTGLDEGHRAALGLYKKLGCEPLCELLSNYAELDAVSTALKDVAVAGDYCHCGADELPTDFLEFLTKRAEAYDLVALTEEKYGERASIQVWERRLLNSLESAEFHCVREHGVPTGALALKKDHERKLGLVVCCHATDDKRLMGLLKIAVESCSKDGLRLFGVFQTKRADGNVAVSENVLKQASLDQLKFGSIYLVNSVDAVK